LRAKRILANTDVPTLYTSTFSTSQNDALDQRDAVEKARALAGFGGDGEADYMLSPRACESIEICIVAQSGGSIGARREATLTSSLEKSINTRAEGLNVFLRCFIGSILRW
jgi:hypothetical protein